MLGFKWETATTWNIKNNSAKLNCCQFNPTTHMTKTKMKNHSALVWQTERLIIHRKINQYAIWNRAKGCRKGKSFEPWSGSLSVMETQYFSFKPSDTTRVQIQGHICLRRRVINELLMWLDVSYRWTNKNVKIPPVTTHYMLKCKTNWLISNIWQNNQKHQFDHNLVSTVVLNVSKNVMIVRIVSPVILRLKVADRDESSTATNCKLVLQWRPLDEGGGSVDPEDDQSGLPHPLLLGPHIGITICSTCHYTVTFGSPVNTYNTP